MTEKIVTEIEKDSIFDSKSNKFTNKEWKQTKKYIVKATNPDGSERIIGNEICLRADADRNGKITFKNIFLLTDPIIMGIYNKINGMKNEKGEIVPLTLKEKEFRLFSEKNELSFYIKYDERIEGSEKVPVKVYEVEGAPACKGLNEKSKNTILSLLGFGGKRVKPRRTRNKKSKKNHKKKTCRH